MLLKKIKLMLKILFLKKETYQRVYLDQRKVGLEKYGKPLEDCDLKEHNWERMLLEEIIDAFQYQDMIEKAGEK